MRRRSCLAIVTVFLAPVLASAQGIQDFSGTWTLDTARSGPAAGVWFLSRAHKFVVSQVASGLVIDADASIADVPGPLTYATDGSEITTINHSVGDIPGWIRKVRTKLIREGASLVTHTSHVSETAGHENVSVTVVLTFTLLANGREMTVERTGFRPKPPPSLHGRPYRQEDDLLYRKDSAIYVKVAQ
jgi:hypothetical protein